MNECDPATSLNGKIEFITDLKQLLERASEMKDAVVPMHCFFPGLGVYLSNHAAVHKNSLNAVERNDSAESKPVDSAQPPEAGTQHVKLAIALMEKMESLSKTTTRLWDDHQLLNDIMDEWRSATGKR